MRALSLIACISLLAACTDRAMLIASDIVVARPIPGTRMSAAYLSLTNTTNQTITITRVSSPSFESVQIHESVLEGGIARMVPLKSLTIPPGQTMPLARGAKHLMLLRPIGSPDVVTLQLYAGETLLLSVTATVEH